MPVGLQMNSVSWCRRPRWSRGGEDRMCVPNSFVAGLVLASLCATGSEATGQSTRAAKAPRRVVDAYCDSVGAHVVYDGGQRVVKTARHDERCSDLRISDDKLAVGWLMTSEVTAKSDGKVVQRWTRSDL